MLRGGSSSTQLHGVLDVPSRQAPSGRPWAQATHSSTKQPDTYPQ
jgi:hypothetical protein